MKKRRNLAFIVELLLLFVILLVVIVVITKTFMQSRGQSLAARHLTEAVCIAEEIAEVTAAAPDKSSAARMLEEMEQAGHVSENEAGIELDMTFAGSSSEQDTYHVAVQWEEEQAELAEGSFVNETILVYYENADEPVYTLETGNWRS